MGEHVTTRKNKRSCLSGWFVAAAVVAAGGFAPAHAATVSYYLDQSNENTFLPDGTNYLKVTISDGAGGNIDFFVETLPSLSGNAGSNYGIQSFGFNTSLSLSKSNIVGLPAGWNVSLDKNLDGFGNFNFVEGGGGSSRTDPVSFSITGIAGDTPMDYVELSVGTASQGNAFFAAHVAGFNDVDPGTGKVTSAYFGGSTPVPLPAAVWLLGAGLGLLSGFARRGR